MKVIIVSGPTATGKTDLAVELALKFGGVVVNFDSLLLYKEINIGTAKPSLTERKRVPHHLIDVRSIAQPMNAAEYAGTAMPLINQLLQNKTNVFLTGGSGFYLQALLKGMYDSPTTPPEIRQRSDKLYDNEGIKPFQEILKLHDPETHNRYHENDHYRIRRAVEHWWANGTPLSQQRVRKDELNQGLASPSVHDWDIQHIYLDMPKEEHLRIIMKRTDRMLDAGLQSEVRDLLEKGFTGLEKPLQSIGYKEILDFHFGVYKNLSECRERIIISTRQLAKSQRTWFKKDSFKQEFHPLQQRPEIYAQVQSFLNR